ncbi:MAG: hypothetical protein HFE73_09275 [Firmicutes bacterium]|nr:hypothetical protein [Bacillota bacterium]
MTLEGLARHGIIKESRMKDGVMKFLDKQSGQVKTAFAAGVNERIKAMEPIEVAR